MPSDCFSNLACFTFPISCAGARLPRSPGLNRRGQRGQRDRLLRFAASTEVMRLVSLEKEERLATQRPVSRPRWRDVSWSLVVVAWNG